MDWIFLFIFLGLVGFFAWLIYKAMQMRGET